MSYFKPQQLTRQLTELRERGFTKGYNVGFYGMEERFTVKRGYPLFVAGLPHHGKSEFIIELCLNLSIQYGLKHFCYFGENGSAAEIVAELCHKYIGKPFRKKIDEQTDNKFAMTEAERLYAEQFINEHFVIFDPEDDNSDIDEFTPQDFYQIVEKAEHELGITFDTTVLDPFNDAVMKLDDYGGREDLWLKDVLKYIRKVSKRKNRTDIVINHIADVKPILDKENGLRYVPQPLPSEWAGGRMWHRRAFTMLLIYRPHPMLCDDNGLPFGENCTLVVNQKAKPKGSGQLGVSKIYWDWKRNQYFGRDYTGREIYFIPKNESVKDKVQQQTITQDYADDLPF